MTRARFLVTLDLPPRVSPAEMAAYIEREVKCGIGQMMPEEPLWNLDRDSVRVQPVGRGRSDDVVYSEWAERLSRLIPAPWRPVSQLPEHVFAPHVVVLRQPVAIDGGTWFYTTAVSTPDGWLTTNGAPPHPDCEFKEVDTDQMTMPG